MKKEIWIDLTKMVKAGMPVFPGDPEVDIIRRSTIADQNVNLSVLSTGMHAGTHLDAPRHFLENGLDVAAIPLEKCAGYANRITIQPNNGILPTADIQKAYATLPVKHNKLLISSGWELMEGTPFYFDGHPGFESDFGIFLRHNRIVLLGVDLPSVKYGTSDYRTAHLDLLRNGVVIVENLVRLGSLPTTFWFVGLPLKLEGFDGSLLRAAARIESP